MTDLQMLRHSFCNLTWYRRTSTKDLVPLFDPKVHLMNTNRFRYLVGIIRTMVRPINRKFWQNNFKWGLSSLFFFHFLLHTEYINALRQKKSEKKTQFLLFLDVIERRPPGCATLIIRKKHNWYSFLNFGSTKSQRQINSASPAVRNKNSAFCLSTSFRWQIFFGWREFICLF